MMIDTPLLHLARRQHGVIARRQFLGDLEWSRSKVHRAVASGLVERLTHNTFLLASAPDTAAARRVAVSLELDGIGFLTGWTAARIFGLRRMPELPVQVAVPSHHRQGLPDWVDVRYSAWWSADDFTADRSGLTVAQPLRMLWSLAAQFNQFRFERAAEDAWHLGLVTPSEAVDYLELHRCSGKNGVTRLERWLERATQQRRPAQSGFEQQLLRALHEVRLPDPERQYPVQLLDGETIHLDIAWPTVRLAVEPGASWWHGGDLRQRLDQARDVACGEVGWQIMRFDESALEDLRGTARRVVNVFAERAAAFGVSLVGVVAPSALAVRRTTPVGGLAAPA